MAEEVQPAGEATAPGSQSEQALDTDEMRCILAWKRFLIAIGCIWIGDQVLGVVALVFSIALIGFDPHNFSMHPVPLVLATIWSWAWAVAVMCYACGMLRGKSFTQAFAVNRVNHSVVWTSILAGTICALIAAALMSLFSTGASLMEELVTNQEDGGLNLIMLVLFMFVPPFEEMYYRGFLFPFFRKNLGVPAAFSIIILWFGMVHVPQLIGDWIAIPVIASMGAVFTIMRHKFDSLTPAILCHFTYNFILVIISIIGTML